VVRDRLFERGPFPVTSTARMDLPWGKWISILTGEIARTIEGNVHKRPPTKTCWTKVAWQVGRVMVILTLAAATQVSLLEY
jgi:hypothetical protein